MGQDIAERKVLQAVARGLRHDKDWCVIMTLDKKVHEILKLHFQKFDVMLTCTNGHKKLLKNITNDKINCAIDNHRHKCKGDVKIKVVNDYRLKCGCGGDKIFKNKTEEQINKIAKKHRKDCGKKLKIKLVEETVIF